MTMLGICILSSYYTGGVPCLGSAARTWGCSNGGNALPQMKILTKSGP